MNSQLNNIPPVWSAGAYWLSAMVLVSLMPKRRNSSRVENGLLAAVILAVQILYMELTGGLSGTQFNLGYVGTALLTMLPFLLLTEQTIWAKFYSCARSFITAGLMASLSWQCVIALEGSGLLPAQPVWESGCMVPLYALFAAAAYFLESKHRKELAEMEITMTTAAGTGVIALIIYILSSLGYAPIETPFFGGSDAVLFNNRTIVYFGGAAILYAYHTQLCQSFVTMERDRLENMLKQQYTGYKINQEAIDVINHKYHDLKHQIAVLRTEIGAEQKLEYLDRMERDISIYENMNQTGNRFIDSILAGKSLRCQTQGIHFTSVVDGDALNFLDPMDISVLLGNAMDNAIEGVEQVPDPEKRLIHLTVTREKRFVRIRLENQCSEVLSIENGLPGTTKLDSRYHGFGLKSICKTAEKYGGSATVHADDGWFELRILIPVPNQGE